MKKIAKLMAFIMAVSIMISGCASKPKDAIAKVNGDYVTKEEFDREYNIFRKMLYGFMTDEQMEEADEQSGQSPKSQLESQITDVLVMDKIMKEELKKKKAEVTEEEIKKGREDMIEQSGGEEKFKAQLEETGLTDEDIQNVIARGLRQEKLIDKYIEEHPVTDEEVKNHFEENKDRYVKYDVAHILVDTEEEAKEIKKQIEEGADFEEIAKEKSKDEGTSANGGSLGEVNLQTNFVPEFLEKMKEMKSGEISEPVKTQFGYHIIYVKNIADNLDDIKSEIEKELSSTEFQKYIHELYEKADIEIYKPKTEVENKTESNKQEDKEGKDKQEQENTESQEKEDKTEENKSDDN
ncbi:MAG: peptidylprolyl isomerase [Tissierellia bacterium]|nr:peptidylprolyl isomerase [Tissierellia bacterium]